MWSFYGNYWTFTSQMHSNVSYCCHWSLLSTFSSTRDMFKQRDTWRCRGGPGSGSEMWDLVQMDSNKWEAGGCQEKYFGSRNHQLVDICFDVSTAPANYQQNCHFTNCSHHSHQVKSCRCLLLFQPVCWKYIIKYLKIINIKSLRPLLFRLKNIWFHFSRNFLHFFCTVYWCRYFCCL